MASEIVFLITEQRNKQRITLPAGSYRFGRSAQCEYVLRRNNVGEVQFVVACTCLLYTSYTPEFKKLVIETMQEEKLSYSET